MLAPLPNTTAFDIEDFLAAEQSKDLLRFTTAGSVDDGKSTLIGRLLYDSRNVYEDHIRSIARSKVNRAGGGLDLSLLTDGLRAEREQGITIDVAYRYFATHRRKFIIADTPGHEQYTRNMATGASTADLAIILIDARNGVQPQSRRHAYIAALLGIPSIAVAVNKMDLAGYRQDVFEAIRAEFSEVLAGLGVTSAWFVPISALAGDNVVNRSTTMPWFDGRSLLEHLETVEIEDRSEEAPFRLPVQYVIRPHQDFRGFAGQIAAGAIRPGDAITVWPSGRTTRVKSIEAWDGELTRAVAPMSVLVTLDDEIDISRGDLLTTADQAPALSRGFDANVVWMHEQPLDTGRPYLLKHTTETVPARVVSIDGAPAATLPMNGIGVVRVETARPIAFDPYRENRTTGSAILIDPGTNATAGALMIVRELDAAPATPDPQGPATLARVVERKLRDRGINIPAEEILGWFSDGEGI